jgi:hypothetical protein
MIDVQREYMYESQDCTRYQYNRDRPALDDCTNRLLISTHWRLLFYAFSSQPGTTVGKSFQENG